MVAHYIGVCDMWQHIVVSVRCSEEIQISILNRKMSLRMSFSPNCQCFRVLLHWFMICLFVISIYSIWSVEKLYATINGCHRHRECFDPVEQYILRVLDLIWMRLLEMPFCVCPPSSAFGSWERARGCTDCAATWLWHLSQHAVFLVSVTFIWGSTVETLAHVICTTYKLMKKINRCENSWQTLWALFRFSQVLNSWSMHSCADAAV